MGAATNLTSTDGYVFVKAATTSYARVDGFHLNAAPGEERYGYIMFPRPFTRGVKIVSATLSLQTRAMPETGSHTLHLDRVVGSWSPSTLTYQKQPRLAAASGKLTRTKSGALPAETVWTFDVTRDMQAVSDGAVWYGWRVSTSDTVRRSVHGTNITGSGKRGPLLTIVWADNPDEPQNLSPHNGVVGLAAPTISFNYVDVSGDVTLTKARVQTSTSESFATVEWDSGEIDVTTDSIDLSEAGYAGAPSGRKTFYRVKVMDGDTLWSDWSTVANFTYTPRAEATITSFSPANPLFSDVTPVISWSSSRQFAWSVEISRADDPFKILWSTGKRVGTERQVTVPPGVLRWDDISYKVTLRTWDDRYRISVPGMNAHQTQWWTVRLDTDQAVAHVTGATRRVITNDGPPKVQLNWTRDSAADGWEIARAAYSSVTDTGEIVARLTHAQAVVGTGAYQWTDPTPPPNTHLRYIIRPIVNGKRGPGRSIEPMAFVPWEGIWLSTPTELLMIAGSDQGEWKLPEQTAVMQVVGAKSPVVIREAVRGYEGSLSGLLVEEDRYQPDLSAQEKRNIFYRIKAKPEGARLIVADMNMPVRLANMNVYPTPFHDLRFACSFDFYQMDVPWWGGLE